MIDHTTIGLIIDYLLLDLYAAPIKSSSEQLMCSILEIMLIFHCSSNLKREKFTSDTPAANCYKDLFGEETELFELAFSCTHIKREENTGKERKQGVIHTLWCQLMMLGLCV